MSVARFIAAQGAEHGVPHAISCRALSVSESWFYKWHNHETTERQRRREQMTEAIRVIFEASGATYGSPPYRSRAACGRLAGVGQHHRGDHVRKQLGCTQSQAEAGPYPARATARGAGSGAPPVHGRRNRCHVGG